jgi:hypothetical protein
MQSCLDKQICQELQLNSSPSWTSAGPGNIIAAAADATHAEYKIEQKTKVERLCA